VDVDRGSPIAPYRQLAGQLRERILSGDLAPGSRLPSADAIAQEAGIARYTARKVLLLLREEGYALSSRGMGTYVAPRDRWPQA
jgi:DNA-binding GntR family transcriptional regulator